MTKAMRDSFVFYRSWIEAIKNLPREMQGEVLTAIIEYGLYGETTESLKPITRAMLAMVKVQIDLNNKRFENGAKGGRPSKKENQGETDQEPNQNQEETKPKPTKNQTKTKQEPRRNQPITKPEPNEYVYVNDNVNTPILSDESIPPSGEKPEEETGDGRPALTEEKKKSSAKKEKKAFRPPSLQEVADYCKEKGYSVNPWKFVNYYASNGWMVGRNHMKDWRAAVRSWESKEHDYGGKDSENKNNRGAGGGVRQEDSLAQKDYSGSF